MGKADRSIYSNFNGHNMDESAGAGQEERLGFLHYDVSSPARQFSTCTLLKIYSDKVMAFA
jgi:hypothetical protein